MARVAFQTALIAVLMAVDLALWGGDTSVRWGGNVSLTWVISSALVVFACLALRGSRLRLVFGLVWSYSLVWAIVMPTYQSFTALLLMLFETSRRLSGRQSAAYLVAAGLLVTVHVSNNAALSDLELHEVIVVAAVWAVLIGAVWLAGRYRLQVQRQMQEKDARHVAEAALARAEERLVLARELHDIVAHSVTAMVMQAGGTLHSQVDLTPRLVTTLTNIETTGNQAMRELRALVGLLHGGGSSRVRASLGELALLIDSTTGSGVDTDLTVVGEPRALGVEADHAAYRAVQEALANVLRHGGPGARASVSIIWGDHDLQLRVVSSQHGNDRDLRPVPQTSGYGLQGMEHRFRALGGHVSAGWTDAEHFEVTATLPSEAVTSRGSGRPVGPEINAR